MVTTCYRYVSIALSSSLYSKSDVEYSNALAALVSITTLVGELLLSYCTEFSLSKLLSTATHTTANDSTSTTATSAAYLAKSTSSYTTSCPASV